MFGTTHCESASYKMLLNGDSSMQSSLESAMYSFRFLMYFVVDSGELLLEVRMVVAMLLHRLVFVLRTAKLCISGMILRIISYSSLVDSQ